MTTNSTRILIITRNLPPLVGGMERLNWHMADELSNCNEVRIIGPKGAATIKPEKTSLTEAPLKPLSFFLLIAFCKALWLAWRWKPNVILAGSGLTAPLAWLASKLSGARSAVYLHGFDITAPSRVYQALWKPTFKKMDRVIVNSTPTKQLSLSAGVMEDKIHLVHPGVNLPKAPQPSKSITTFKKQHGLKGKKLLLSVGRLTTRKGLREFVEHALPDIIRAEPNTVLLIVGEAPKNSLGAGIQTEESIKAQAQKSGVSEHLQFLGVITDQRLLATVYEASDVHIFPVRHIPDDPEGFGMVAIEAAAHGLPTVAFETGGIIDAVSDGVSGHLVQNGDYQELSKQVLAAIQHSFDVNCTQKFAQKFSWSHFGQKIFRALTVKAQDQSMRTGHHQR